MSLEGMAITGFYVQFNSYSDFLAGTGLCRVWCMSPCVDGAPNKDQMGCCHVKWKCQLLLVFPHWFPLDELIRVLTVKAFALGQVITPLLWLSVIKNEAELWQVPSQLPSRWSSWPQLADSPHMTCPHLTRAVLPCLLTFSLLQSEEGEMEVPFIHPCMLWA